MKPPSNPSKSFQKLNPTLYPPECSERSENPDGAESVKADEIPCAPRDQLSKLNKTERRFFQELKMIGHEKIFIQDVTLRLGQDCRYTPDFFTTQPEPAFWEVKGFMRDDALVKLKVAARTHTWARFVLVRWKDGHWSKIMIDPT